MLLKPISKQHVLKWGNEILFQETCKTFARSFLPLLGPRGSYEHKRRLKATTKKAYHLSVQDPRSDFLTRSKSCYWDHLGPDVGTANRSDINRHIHYLSTDVGFCQQRLRGFWCPFAFRVKMTFLKKGRQYLEEEAVGLTRFWSRKW